MLLRPTRYINSAAPEISPGQFFNAHKGLQGVVSSRCATRYCYPAKEQDFNACKAFLQSLLPFLARYRYPVKEQAVNACKAFLQSLLPFLARYRYPVKEQAVNKRMSLRAPQACSNSHPPNFIRRTEFLLTSQRVTRNRFQIFAWFDFLPQGGLRGCCRTQRIFQWPPAGGRRTTSIAHLAAQLPDNLASFLRNADSSAPLKPTSLITFLFGDKKVI